jgi:hypothetical protein
MSDARFRPTGEASALDIAQQWAQLPPEHLKAALKALEPQLVREHDLRAEELNQAALRDQRNHRLLMSGLVAGYTIAITALIAATLVGIHGHTLLSAVLVGPSVPALVSLFLTRGHVLDRRPFRDRRLPTPGQR